MEIPRQDALVIPKTAMLPYVWAGITVATLGAAFVLLILLLRPNADPLVVIGGVSAPLIPTLAGVFAVMKAQETHLSVNSRLTAFIQATTDAASAKGQLQGAADEQARQAALPSPEVRP